MDKNSILENEICRMLIRIGTDENDLDYFFAEDLEDGEISHFTMQGGDNISYSLIETVSNSFVFKIEFEGGYQMCKREFSDVVSLKHHVDKLGEIISLMYSINAVHNHLFEAKEVNREVNLKKLI